jgi:hypothetical protein
MVYIDSVRAKTIQAFKDQVIDEKIEPYRSFIEQRHWSESLLIQCYHDHYYQKYYWASKQERQKNFWQKWQILKPKDPLQAGLYALRTALMEGMVIESAQSLYRKLQTHWRKLEHQGKVDRSFFDPYIGVVLSYYQHNEDQFPDILKEDIEKTQQAIARKLSATRNLIYHHACHPQQGGWREQYRLWQQLLMYDQREADHLASLDPEEFRHTQYWQTVSHALKQKNYYQCSQCDWIGPLYVEHCRPEYRGQEILPPQSLVLLCPDCYLETLD